MLPKGFGGLKEGREQTITFPPIGDLKADGTPVDLRATSDAGLPVEYYVASGPAVIEGGGLKAADIPAKATFPITVKVVACQFGRAVAPQVKTAGSVEQSAQINAGN